MSKAAADPIIPEPITSSFTQTPQREVEELLTLTRVREKRSDAAHTWDNIEAVFLWGWLTGVEAP
jgi:hypothetical protein